MNKLLKSKPNKTKRFGEIITLVRKFRAADWSCNATSASENDYRIVKAFPDVGLDIRLYLSDDGSIRLCVYSCGMNKEKDLEILRKINIHPSTGVEFSNGSDHVRESAKTYNLFRLIRYTNWWSMDEKDCVTLCADYAWLIAELHRIGAV